MPFFAACVCYNVSMNDKIISDLTQTEIDILVKCYKLSKKNNFVFDFASYQHDDIFNDLINAGFFYYPNTQPEDKLNIILSKRAILIAERYIKERLTRRVSFAVSILSIVGSIIAIIVNIVKLFN